MIAGLGSDVIEIERIRKSVTRFQERFLKRVFTSDELKYCQSKADPAPHLAGRFAAKEALVKALGTGLRGSMKWSDIEVCRDDKGAPFFRLSGAVKQACEEASIKFCHVTLSHSQTVASSTVILEL